MSQIRINGPRTEAENAGGLMNVSDLRTLKNYGYRSPLSGVYKVLFYSRYRQKCRDRNVIFIDAAV